MDVFTTSATGEPQVDALPANREPAATDPDPGSVAEELMLEELVIDDLSIDGMCGVY